MYEIPSFRGGCATSRDQLSLRALVSIAIAAFPIALSFVADDLLAQESPIAPKPLRLPKAVDLDTPSQPRIIAQDDTAQEQSTAPIRVVSLGDLRRAIRDLNSDSAQIRKEAEETIIAAGPIAMSYLPSLSDDSTGEYAVSIQRIRTRLEAEANRRFVASKPIQIKTPCELREFAKSLSEQSNTEVLLGEIENLSERLVHIPIDNASFWSALFGVAKEQDLIVTSRELGQGNMRFMLESSERQALPPFASDGPVIGLISNVSLTRQFAVAGSGIMEGEIQVMWEPRLQPIYVRVANSSIRATIGSKVVEALSPQAEIEYPIYAGNSTLIRFQLANSEERPSELSALDLTVQVAFEKERQRFEFTNLTRKEPETQTYDKFQISHVGTRMNGAVVESRLLLEYSDAHGALESFRGWVSSNEVYLIGPDGEKREAVGQTQYSNTDKSAGMSFLFQIDKPLDQYTLVYEAPSGITPIEANLKFERIPLP